MASKGQKFRKYTNETISLILDEHNNQNVPSTILSKKYDTPTEKNKAIHTSQNNLKRW